MEHCIRTQEVSELHEGTRNEDQKGKEGQKNQREDLFEGVDDQWHDEEDRKGINGAKSVFEPEVMSEEVLPKIENVVAIVSKHERMGLSEKVNDEQENNGQGPKREGDVWVESNLPYEYFGMEESLAD